MAWEVVESLFKEIHTVRQQIDSFDDFVENRIKRIIEENNVVETNRENTYVIFGDLRIEKPVVTEADGSRRAILPMEARIRNRTYASPLFLQMTLIEDGMEKETEEIYIGDLPVMVKSTLCHLRGMSKEELIKAGEDPYEPGGYFIINGTERPLVMIEDLAPNRLIITKEVRGNKEIVNAGIVSTRSGFRAKTNIIRNRDGTIYIEFPMSPRNLNIITVIKALGLDKDSEILSMFEKDHLLDIYINLESAQIKNQEEAIKYLGKRIAPSQPETYRQMRAIQILDYYLLPHIGTKEDARIKKAYFLCETMKKVIDVAHGKRLEDDKDHYANKRVKLPGTLMEELFRYAFSYFMKDMRYQIERTYARGRKLQLKSLVRPDALTDRIMFSMSTGNWVGGRTGVSQVLDRFAYIATLTHMRRVRSPLSASHPHFEARDLHPTHFGKLCPSETPEGPNCGLVKHLAIGAVVSSRTKEDISKQLQELGVELITKG